MERLQTHWGLAEISTRRIFDALADDLAYDYLRIWEDSGTPQNTGLGLLLSRRLFAGAEVIDVHRPTVLARPRYIIVRCNLHTVAEASHSRRNQSLEESHAVVSGTIPHNADRLESADLLGQFLANRARATCVVVAGDFNSEPFEPPFGERRLRAHRSFSRAIWVSATPAYLYNCAWRWLPEPDVWEVASQLAYAEPRPKTTHGDSIPLVFDQIMVSGQVLRGGPLRLLEDTARVHFEEGTTATRRRGVLRPFSWRFISPR